MFECPKHSSTSSTEQELGISCTCTCLNPLPPSSSSSSGFIPFKECCKESAPKRKPPPNIQHEVNVAKSILRECSSISGDNLFDHLSDLIKHIVDERPPNVIDFFEEYSRNVREQKFRVPENCAEISYYEPKNFRIAQEIIGSMKLPPPLLDDFDYCEEEEFMESQKGKEPSKVESTDEFDADMRSLDLNENVIQMQLYWSLCGFGFHMEEIYQLSLAMQKLQYHSSIRHCRFWGKVYGLKKSYFVVEVELQKDEIERRLEKMKAEMMDKMAEYHKSKEHRDIDIKDKDLIAGTNWQNHPAEDLAKMKKARKDQLPQSQFEEEFDTPPEPIGNGLNRKTYFVINSLREEWIELPIVTPKQVQIARKIKKYFTGDLEAEIFSYPMFPGTEKHYLRATIARITSGTYIAPNGYYRVKTAKDFRLESGEELGEEDEEEEEEEVDEEEGENKTIDNDAIIMPDATYKPLAPRDLMNSTNWMHIRPHILKQGRVNFFDIEKARKEWEKEMLKNGANAEEGEEEEEEADEEEEEEEDGKTTKPQPESGPALFTSCLEDISEEFIPSWTARFSSAHNRMNRILIMKSNTWPGAYNFAFENVCDSIYLGWGHKFTARNFSPQHIPTVQEECPTTVGIMEILDPTVAEEEEWRLAHLKPEKLDLEEMDEEEEDEDDED